MNKRNILIITSSTIVVSTLGYFIYTKFRNKKEIDKIHSLLDGGTGRYGSIEDFAKDVFTGSNYVNDMRTAHRNLIMLNNDSVTGFRRALENAIKGWGTNEDSVKDVFRKLKDRVQIAQISASYQKANGENLLDALKGEMDVDSDEMKDLFDTMKNKPAYRISK